jgi:(1->4)-alpha-D-glucan 1-alpha-D-glucosylmutase
VLARGRSSSWARFFDIDWGDPDAPRRLRLPILGAALEEAVAQRDVRIDAHAAEVCCYDTRLPLADGSLGVDPHAFTGEHGSAATLRVLAAQHYELAFWRTAGQELNYRRFFDITDLVGVRVEDGDVFAETHSLVRRLAADGVITGLRIDHIDGLRDPHGYLQRLRREIRGPDGAAVYTIVEKILEHDERLPPEWECEGTTGYEFLTLATGLLIDGGGHERLEQFYQRITGDPKPFGELVREKKLLVIDRLFGSETNALARTFAELAGIGLAHARRSLTELTASMGVYRTYTRSAETRAEDRSRIEEALADAGRRNPDLDLVPIRRAVLLEDSPVTDAALDWVLRWQQFTGPVMAKGFEDTALYCHNALLAANEVGSDPRRVAVAADELHALLEERRRQSPQSLNATATHDTKRGEDTRARIAVLSEVADEWRPRLRSWVREGEAWKAEIADDEDTSVPDADVDSLLYQTLVGAWPLTGADADFTDRIKAYMTKAVREAKEQTSWRRPDEDYEQALARFIDTLMEEFGRAGLAEDVARFATRVAPHGAINSLAQMLLKVTAPGIPDLYQGTELWSLTLVDPDNRQPVDFARRRQLGDALGPLLETPQPAAIGELMRSWQDGRIKLLLTGLALRCRARHAAVFDRGACIPVATDGQRAAHIVAFARELDDNACITVLPRWTTRLPGGGGGLATGAAAWGDTTLLPGEARRGTWRNALTGERLEVRDDRVAIADVLNTLPLALLERV